MASVRRFDTPGLGWYEFGPMTKHGSLTRHVITRSGPLGSDPRRVPPVTAVDVVVSTDDGHNYGITDPAALSSALRVGMRVVLQLDETGKVTSVLPAA